MKQKARKARTADPFDIWGKPPQIVLDQLGKKDHDRLRRYITKVAETAYRIAYDNGHVEGLAAVVSLANKRLNARLGPR